MKADKELALHALVHQNKVKQAGFFFQQITEEQTQDHPQLHLTHSPALCIGCVFRFQFCRIG